MIDQEVIDQAEKIREAGPVNMVDRIGVQHEANKREFYALVLWVEDHPNTYGSLLGALMDRGKGEG